MKNSVVPRSPINCVSHPDDSFSRGYTRCSKPGTFTSIRVFASTRQFTCKISFIFRRQDMDSLMDRQGAQGDREGRSGAPGRGKRARGVSEAPKVP